MGIIHRNRHSGQAAGACDLLVGRDAELSELADRELGRDEADAFADRTRSVDPYALWLERRQEEQDRTRPQIRWVYHYRAAIRAQQAASDRNPGGEAERRGLVLLQDG